MKKHSIILFICCLSITLFGQDLCLDWSFTLGDEEGNVYQQQRTIDHEGNVYISGSFDGVIDFDPSSVSMEIEAAFPRQPFIANYSSEGELLYVLDYHCYHLYIQSPASISVNALEVKAMHTDLNNNLFVVGAFVNEVDFNPGNNDSPVIIDAGEEEDMFVAIYDPAGNLEVVFNIPYAIPYDLEIDAAGNFFVFGNLFEDNIDFDPTLENTLMDKGGFLAKYRGSTTSDLELDFGHGFSTGFSQAAQFSINEAGDFAIAENLALLDQDSINVFIDSDNAIDSFIVLEYDGYYKAVILKFDSNNEYHSQIQLDSGVVAFLSGLHLSESGQIIISGSMFVSPDFDPSPDETLFLGTNDVSLYGLTSFLASYSAEDSLLFAGSFLHPESNPGTGLLDDFTVNKSGVLYGSGWFGGQVDFDFSVNTEVLTGTGYNCFLVKYDLADGQWLGAYHFEGMIDVWFLALDNDENAKVTFANDNSVILTCNLQSTNSDIDFCSDEQTYPFNAVSKALIAKYTDDTITDTEEPAKKTGFKIFPNPVSTSAILQLSKIYQELELSILDLNGKEISRQVGAGKELTINRGNLPSGVSIFHLIGDGEYIGAGKLIFF